MSAMPPLRVHEHSAAEVAEWIARGWDDRVDCRECIHLIRAGCEIRPRSIIVPDLPRHCGDFSRRAKR